MTAPPSNADRRNDNSLTPNRLRAVVVVGWLLLGGFVVHTAWRGGIAPHVRSFQLLFLGGTIGYFLVVWALTRIPNEKVLGDWRWWLLGMLALRLVLIGTHPSDDAWRYAWEGRVQQAGFNPFAVAPDDESLRHLRDDNWHRISHPDYPAIYPPLAQLEFRLAAVIYYSVYTVKALHVLWDILTIVILARVLRHRGRPRHLAAIYGLCPLVVTAFAIEGHVDSLMLLFVALGLLAETRGRHRLAGVMLGVSIAAKLMSAVLLPWLLWRHRRAGATAIVVIAICYLPYLDAGGSVFRSLVRFGNADMFFSLPGILSLLSDDFTVSPLFLCAVLAIILVLLAMRHRDLQGYARAAFWSLIFLLPVVHYWYLTWVVLFQLVRPRMMWLAASVATLAYFEAEHVRVTTGTWRMSDWCPVFFWCVLVCGWIADSAVKRRRNRREPSAVEE